MDGSEGRGWVGAMTGWVGARTGDIWMGVRAGMGGS